MPDTNRNDWERSLIAFLTTPPAPKPKGAQARRVTPRKPRNPNRSSRCVYPQQ